MKKFFNSKGKLIKLAYEVPDDVLPFETAKWLHSVGFGNNQPRYTGYVVNNNLMISLSDGEYRNTRRGEIGEYITRSDAIVAEDYMDSTIPAPDCYDAVSFVNSNPVIHIEQNTVDGKLYFRIIAFNSVILMESEPDRLQVDAIFNLFSDQKFRHIFKKYNTVKS